MQTVRSNELQKLDWWFFYLQKPSCQDGNMGFFQRKKREHATKSSSKTQKKLLPSWSLQKAVWYMALKDMVIKTNRNFTQILWYCVSQPWILGRLHEFELPCHCQYACCFTQFGVETLMANTFWKKEIWLLDTCEPKNMLHTKKTHTTVFPNMAIFGKSPCFWEYMSTQ